MSDTPNPNVFFRGDDMGIGNFPIKGGKISNQPINDGGYWFEKFHAANERIKRLEREIELLRYYGNKDCIGMADEVIASEIVTAYPMVWKEVRKEANP